MKKQSLCVCMWTCKKERRKWTFKIIDSKREDCATHTLWKESFDSFRPPLKNYLRRKWSVHKEETTADQCLINIYGVVKYSHKPKDDKRYQRHSQQKEETIQTGWIQSRFDLWVTVLGFNLGFLRFLSLYYDQDSVWILIFMQTEMPKN